MRRTDMSALGDAHGTSKTTLDLSHVYHARHANHLQHAIVVSRSHELVVTFWTPWVGPRRPADKHMRDKSKEGRKNTCTVAPK